MARLRVVLAGTRYELPLGKREEPRAEVLAASSTAGYEAGAVPAAAARPAASRTVTDAGPPKRKRLRTPPGVNAATGSRDSQEVRS